MNTENTKFSKNSNLKQYHSIGYDIADIEIKSNSNASIKITKNVVKIDQSDNRNQQIPLTSDKDAIIEEVLGVLMDKTPTQVKDYIKSLKGIT